MKKICSLPGCLAVNSHNALTNTYDRLNARTWGVDGWSINHFWRLWHFPVRNLWLMTMMTARDRLGQQIKANSGAPGETNSQAGKPNKLNDWDLGAFAHSAVVWFFCLISFVLTRSLLRTYSIELFALYFSPIRCRSCTSLMGQIKA